MVFRAAKRWNTSISFDKEPELPTIIKSWVGFSTSQQIINVILCFRFVLASLSAVKFHSLTTIITRLQQLTQTIDLKRDNCTKITNFFKSWPFSVISKQLSKHLFLSVLNLKDLLFQDRHNKFFLTEDLDSAYLNK